MELGNSSTLHDDHENINPVDGLRNNPKENDNNNNTNEPECEYLEFAPHETIENNQLARNRVRRININAPSRLSLFAETELIYHALLANYEITKSEIETFKKAINSANKDKSCMKEVVWITGVHL